MRFDVCFIFHYYFYYYYSFAVRVDTIYVKLLLRLFYILTKKDFGHADQIESNIKELVYTS